MWTLEKVDQKCMESFEMWCWRIMEKISWTDHVRNEEVLHRVKEERNIVRILKRRKDDWIGHILHRICLLKHLTEGKIEKGTEATGRKRKDVSSYCMTLRNERIIEIERGSTRSHFLENSV
jgi:hypothetical protein